MSSSGPGTRSTGGEEEEEASSLSSAPLSSEDARRYSLMEFLEVRRAEDEAEEEAAAEPRREREALQAWLTTLKMGKLFEVFVKEEYTSLDFVR